MWKHDDNHQLWGSIVRQTEMIPSTVPQVPCMAGAPYELTLGWFLLGSKVFIAGLWEWGISSWYVWLEIPFTPICIKKMPLMRSESIHLLTINADFWDHFHTYLGNGIPPLADSWRASWKTAYVSGLHLMIINIACSFGKLVFQWNIYHYRY